MQEKGGLSLNVPVQSRTQCSSRRCTQGCPISLVASMGKELSARQWPLQAAQGGAREGRPCVHKHVTNHLLLQLISLEFFLLGQPLPWDA